jgi:ubiquinone/menaquinone biosynthesis C-methylase UbiE
MTWQEFYGDFYSDFSEKRMAVGIRDWEQRSKVLVSWLSGLPKSIRILDCGCGCGTCGRMLLDSGFKNIVGVDKERKLLEHAKKAFECREMDCQKLDFPDKSFDVLLGLNIMQYLPDTKAFFSEARRVLKNDGLLVLSFPNDTFLKRLLGRSPVEADHLYHWNHNGFKAFLRRNGWEVTSMEPIGRFKSLALCNTIMVRAKMM